MTNYLLKFYNFVQREFAYSQQVDQQGNYLPYGVKNSFPTELAFLVDGSPTATSCLSTTADFITGEGFNEGDDLENVIVNNQGLTFFEYHTALASSLAHYWGVATLVKFNAVGQITELYPIPFQNCRLGKPDDKGTIGAIHYNPYFGTNLYKQEDTEIYPTFNPQQAVTQYGKDPKKFKGQIFWMGIRDRKHPFYPIPDYYSAKHWMRVEYNASIYFDENLENGFLQPMLMKLRGNANDASGVKESEGSEKELTKGQLFDREMSREFSGAKRVAKIMAMWADIGEEWPTFEPFPTNGNADMYRVQDEHAIKKITIATKTPAILANISEGVSLGGDGNTIRAAVKLMQQRVKRLQSLLTSYYGKLLPQMVNPITDPVTIVDYNPFPEMESVDPQVWGVLTAEEKRKWVKDHTEIEIMDSDVAGETITTEEQPQAKFQNMFFNSYPAKAKENVKRAVEWQKKFNAKCLKPAGLKMSEAILNGQPLSISQIRRLSRYLSEKTVHKNNPFGEGCESLEYHAWGGSEMMVWANEKLREFSGKAD